MDKLRVNLIGINVYSADYSNLIANILQGKKMKINIKILPLIKSISFVGIKVKYQKEYIDQIDAYIYGLLNIFSMLDIKRIDSFKYQRVVGENKIEIKANIKVRLLKVLLSQWTN